MTKTQKEGIVTAGLFLLLVYMVWANFLADGSPAGPEPERTRREEVPEPEPEPEPAVREPARDWETARLRKERAEMEWGPDPFLEPVQEPEPEPEPEEPDREETAELVLRGIASLNGRRQALIGIKTVTVGDEIDGYEVVSISRSAVVLRKEGEEYEIHIRD